MYIETATRFLEDNGRFVVCEGNLARTNVTRRAETCGTKNNLKLLDTLLVYGKEGKPALFAVHVFATGKLLQDESNEPPPTIRHLAIRLGNGRRSKEYNDLCQDMGIPAYVEDDKEKS